MKTEESYSTVDCNGIAVRYKDHLDGGGNDFGRAYLPFVASTFGKVGTLLEWCCGPGFIGFSMLTHGLCDHLGLTDINEEALSACRATVRANDLVDQVSLFHSDCFDSVPDDTRWDLVVGNPPHMNVNIAPAHEIAILQSLRPERVYADRDWNIHRRFYRQVGSYLAPGGSVVLQECWRASDPEVFRPMIVDAGLEIVDAIPCEPPHELFYFLWVRRAGQVRL
ncbi:MAG: methyltransferase [Pseudonocardiaceae bacterium]